MTEETNVHPALPVGVAAAQVPAHIRAMAAAIKRQTNSTHPREEVDLDAVDAVMRWVLEGAQAAEREVEALRADALVLELLVAAGHVSQDKLAMAREIGAALASKPPATPEAGRRD